MKKIFFLLLLFGITSIHAFSQGLTVSGKVIDDSTQSGVAGVSIVVSETRQGVSTDNNGNFKIAVRGTLTRVTLAVSYIGYRSQSLTVNNANAVTIMLRKDQSSLDDVVVIGYQTVRRRDLLASVSSVSAKELKDIPINSAAEALNGRLAGVTASTSEGSPDAEVRVRVRGGMSITQDNSPLYIVDGVQVENGLNSIAPQDIQTIDVLKDASATAIYGARGANGVIVITTKSGRPGKLKLSYNGFVGVKSLARKLNVLSPYEFVEYAYERSRGSATDSASFAKSYGTTWDTLANYKNVEPIDWQEEVMGQTGISQTNNVTFTGGTKKSTYNFSYTNNNDKAIVQNSRYTRNLLNVKGDHKLTKNIKIGLAGRLTNQDVYGAGVSDDRGSSFNKLRNAVKYRPFLSDGQDIDDNDPFADPNVGNGLSLTNPIILANSEYRKKSTNGYNITANINVNLTKKISFRSTFGYDRNKLVDKLFNDSITPYAVTQGDKKPIISLDTTERKILTNSNVLTYSLKGWKQKHDIDFLVGEETYQLETQTNGRTLKGYALGTSPNKAFSDEASGTIVGLPRLFKSKYTNISFFSRLNYAYLDKYLFSVNFRADGASKFAPGRQWGYFPAGSIAWRAKKEKFLANVTWLNDLKFRVGYGTVGNNRINDYLFLTTFRNDQLFYGINGQLVPAYTSTALVNEKLKWESTVNRNYGVDITLFKNRVNMSVDYYNNSSKELLLNVPVASTYGYVSQLQNVGKTSNKGVELQISADLVRRGQKDFSWTATFNIAANRSRIEQLGVGQNFFYPSPSWGVSGQPTDYIVKVGEPVGTMYGLVTDGFYKVEDFNYNATTRAYTLKTGVVNNSGIIGAPQPGSIKFKDLNNDGVVDLDKDRTIIGNPTPDFTGGLNQQFTYKNWDASVFVNFVYGNDIYNANKIELTNGYSANSNMLDIMRNRWKTINDKGQVVTDPTALAALNANATIWKPITGSGAFYPHSWAIEDGSFLRLNNITIGYTFPVKTLVKLKMSRLRLYATANNLAVLTNYSGYDPEVSVRNFALTPNLDYSAYPKSRTYIFGLNVTF